MCTSGLRRNEILSAPNHAKENSGYSIQGSKRMAISMCTVRMHLSGLSKRRQPQTNINACPRHGSHVVHFRIELWSRGTCFGQPGRRHPKNECLSRSSIRRREGAGHETKAPVKRRQLERMLRAYVVTGNGCRSGSASTRSTGWC